MDLSVVIPTLNSPLLPTVVGALRRQLDESHVSAEIVVAGLEPHGLTTTLGARYVTTGSAVNAGAARNLGARSSRGTWLIFLDADCVVDPGWLQAIVSRLIDPTVVIGGAIRIDRDMYLRRAANIAEFYEFTTKLPMQERRFLASFTLALHREAFEAVGGFDESLPFSGGEDIDLTIRLRKAGYRLVFEPKASVLHLPDRRSLQRILRHAAHSGGNSIRVRQRYPKEFGMPSLLFRWPALIAFSPLLATAVTSKALLKNQDVRGNWSVIPLFYLIKLAWCWGAAKQLKRNATSTI